MKNWDDNEILYLKENYNKINIDLICKYLNRSEISLRRKASRLNLVNKKLTPYKKPLEIIYPSLQLFQDLYTKEICYIMGYLWSDGYVYKNKISLECVADDLMDVEHIFDSIGEWRKSVRERKGRKKQTTFGIYKKEYYNLFVEYNFLNKSKESPNFLDKISNENLKYFFRGIIDGDGCIYINRTRKNIQYQFYFCGSYEQDWSYIEEYLTKLEIKYTIKQKVQKTGKYSVVYVWKDDIIKLLDIIYDGYDNDRIGLKRKYEKFKWIKN